MGSARGMCPSSHVLVILFLSGRSDRGRHEKEETVTVLVLVLLTQRAPWQGRFLHDIERVRLVIDRDEPSHLDHKQSKYARSSTDSDADRTAMTA